MANTSRVSNADTAAADIKPPPDFPFIVLPALLTEQQPISDPKPQRRRLASNVISMFDEDREPVQNPRRCGRHGVEVIRFKYYRSKRLRPGVCCYLWGGPNHGRFVIVKSSIKASCVEDAGRWTISVLGEPLDVVDNDGKLTKGWTTTIEGDRLRRCSPPNFHQGKGGAQ